MSRIHNIWSIPQTATCPLGVTPLVCWTPCPTQFPRGRPMASKAPKLGLWVSAISVSLHGSLQRIQPSQAPVGGLYCPLQGTALSGRVCSDTRQAFHSRAGFIVGNSLGQHREVKVDMVRPGYARTPPSHGAVNSISRESC